MRALGAPSSLLCADIRLPIACSSTPQQLEVLTTPAVAAASPLAPLTVMINEDDVRALECALNPRHFAHHHVSHGQDLRDTSPVTYQHTLRLCDVPTTTHAGMRPLGTTPCKHHAKTRDLGSGKKGSGSALSCSWSVTRTDRLCEGAPWLPHETGALFA
jgi:hypothetical protein